MSAAPLTYTDPSWRAALHNAPPRRSDRLLPGNAGYDAFVAGCHARHNSARDRWLRERSRPQGLLGALFGGGFHG